MKHLFRRFLGALSGGSSSSDDGLSAELRQPIQAVERAVAELETSLADATDGLSQVKAVVVDLKRQVDEQRMLANDYEARARQTLLAVQSGELTREQAQDRAGRAMTLREQALDRLRDLEGEHGRRRQAADGLQARVEGLRREIAGHQNELVTLRARARTAQSMEKINRRLAGMDPNDALSALETVRHRVESSEAMAHAYGEVGKIGQDDGGRDTPEARASASLESLAAELGLDSRPVDR